MIIHGREINFKRTVKATCDISEMSPNGDISKFDELLPAENYSKTASSMIKFIIALSKGYEYAKAFEDLDYKPNPVTEDFLLNLEMDELTALFTEAGEVWAGEKITVETEEPKGKGKNAAGDSE